MRLVVAKRRGRRGEGLGNEMFAWAKGWIASQVLDATLIGPAWGINPRRYYRNFGTPRWDVFLEEAAKCLPHYAFTEQDYHATGKTDFGEAIQAWASQLHLTQHKHFCMTVDGMYGGYPAIDSAREFLRSKLLCSKDALSNLHRVMSRFHKTKLLVAVHVRSGDDFAPVDRAASVRSSFNITIPAEWYRSVCEALAEEYGDAIQFYFISNRHDSNFFSLVDRFSPGQAPSHGLNECSDLLLLAQADLRICSVSSYSLAASFLAGGPYVWYEPQLNLQDGMYTLWSHEPAQQDPGSLSRQSIRFAQETLMMEPGFPSSKGKPIHPGTAMATGDPLPADLVHSLNEKLRLLDRRTNLIHYGAVPAYARHGLTEQRPKWEYSLHK